MKNNLRMCPKRNYLFFVFLVQYLEIQYLKSGAKKALKTANIIPARLAKTEMIIFSPGDIAGMIL